MPFERRNRSLEAREFARDRRRLASVAEQIFWRVLRDRNKGLKFRREYAIGPYFADFFCVEARVCVELDGEQHDAERDLVRDEWMKEQGIETIRVPNLTIFDATDSRLWEWVDLIVIRCSERV